MSSFLSCLVWNTWLLCNKLFQISSYHIHRIHKWLPRGTVWNLAHEIEVGKARLMVLRERLDVESYLDAVLDRKKSHNFQFFCIFLGKRSENPEAVSST